MPRSVSPTVMPRGWAIDRTNRGRRSRRTGRPRCGSCLPTSRAAAPIFPPPRTSRRAHVPAAPRARAPSHLSARRFGRGALCFCAGVCGDVSIVPVASFADGCLQGDGEWGRRMVAIFLPGTARRNVNSCTPRDH